MSNGSVTPSYNLTIGKHASKEWDKLDYSIRERFKKKLRKIIKAPMTSHVVTGLKDCYYIKLRSDGFRLIYYVIDNELVISVLAVNKREDCKVYELAKERYESIINGNNTKLVI